MKNKFFCVNAWGCATEYRTHLAFELIRVMMAADVMHADVDRSGKSVPPNPKQIAERAYAVVDEWAEIAIQRGDFENPDINRKVQ